MESNSPRAIHALSPQFKQNQPQRNFQRQGDINAAQKQLISIDDVDPFEQNRTINSPKSLYACRQEGIFPKELLFKPLQAYEDPKKRLPPEIVKMRFDFFESKRLEMINTVKRARQRLIDDIRSPSAMTQRLRQQSVQKGFETTRDSLVAGASQQSTQRIFGNSSMKVGLATSRSQADLSQLTSGQSKFLQASNSSVIDQANQRDRELFQKQMELAERTRQKEAKMVEMMIKNEEAKNNKIEENQRRFEDLMLREKNRSKLIQQKLKEEAERKYQEEIHRTREEVEREKSEKRNQWEKFIQKLEIQKEEEKIQDFKKEMRKQIIQEREKLRQEKFRICQERNEQMMDQTRMKIQIAQTKYAMMLHKLEERKKEFQQRQKIKKQEKEFFKQKVFENINRQEEEKERSWIRKQEQEREKEKKIKREKERQMKEQLQKAQLQDKKIQDTLLVSERREQERKDVLMQKQHEASERLERQRQRQKFEELMKKEMFNLKNLSKDFNRQRATRKNEFVKEQMMEKLETDRVRYEAMTTERNHLKAVRIQTLVESEIQRENIRNALYQMSVWNTFDPKVIFHIMGQEKQHEGKGLGGGDLTVDELVRKSAISAQRQRKINRHQFSSSLGFQSMKSLSQPSTNALSNENIDQRDHLKIQVGTPNTNLFGFVSPAKTLSHFYPDDATSQQLEPQSPHLNETPQLQKEMQSQQVSFVNQSQSQLAYNEENSNSQQVLNGSSFSKPQNTQALTTAHDNEVSRLHPNLYAPQYVEDSMIHQTKPGDQNSYFKDGQMISGINQSSIVSQAEDQEHDQIPQRFEENIPLAQEEVVRKKKKGKKSKTSKDSQQLGDSTDNKKQKKPKNRDTAKFLQTEELQNQLSGGEQAQEQRQEFYDDNYDYGEEKNFIQDDDQD